MPVAALETLLEIAPSLQLVLVNDTERNFTDVEVEALLHGPVSGWDRKRKHIELPPRPRPFGTPTKNPLLASLAIRDINPIQASLRPGKIDVAPRPTIDNSASARIVFPRVDLRPHARMPLHHVVCIAGPAGAGTTLTLEWSATATDADGVARGQLNVDAHTPLELLAEERRTAEGRETK